MTADLRQKTGARIRDRRLSRGIAQSELARSAGISPSYLNLIEHDRRRIGGKLLNDIARALDVEPASLAEGVAPDLAAALRAAAGTLSDAQAELDRVEEFAGKFPGWARLVAAQGRRLEALERNLEALNDRLTHDPLLQTSLHDVLSTVTAIRSTTAILSEGGEIEPHWRNRFHRNLYEDSRRLAASSQALVAYLDTAGDATRIHAAPLDEVEAWLDSAGWAPDAATPAHDLATPAGRHLAERWAVRLRRDAAALPEAAFRAAQRTAADPLAMAASLGLDVATVLRRWAVLTGVGRAGLVVCDASGTPTLRKGVAGFATPPFGAGCPLWPLYRALGAPGTAVRDVIDQGIGARTALLAYAVSATSRPSGYDGPVLQEATMLLLPEPPPDLPAIPVGAACRICARHDCIARREPSVLGEA